MKEDIKDKGTGLQLNFSGLRNFTQSNKLKKSCSYFHSLSTFWKWNIWLG